DLGRARAYGFLPSGVSVAPYLRDLVTASFGVEEVHVPGHGYRPLDVTVAFARIHGGAPASSSASEHEVKVAGIHRHHVRNRRVAKLARAVHANDLGVVEEVCPDAPRHLPEGRLGVGVLVDDVSHGLELSGRLGWPLLAGEDVDVVGLSSRERAMITGERRNEQPVVVTGAGMAKAGRFDVLVRADGGVGLPELPGELLRVRHGGGRRLLLVDCDDRHHPLLRRRSRRRREAYLEAGWRVVGREVTALD